MLMTNTVLFGVGAGLVATSWINFANHHSPTRRTLEALLSIEQPMLLMTVALMLGGLFHSFTILYPALIKREVEQLQALSNADSFRDQAHRDGLTGVHNRRFFDQTIRAYVNEFKSKRASFGLLLLDLDHFKKINDNFGHEVGDLVLKEVCVRMKALIREHDVFARIGGEEFAVIATFAGNEQLPIIAERYRTQIEALQIPVGDTIINPTVSIGAAVNKGVDNPDELFNVADARLYEAKRAGRNRVSI